MLLRSICAPIFSGLVLYQSVTAGSLLAQERPPFVDELPTQHSMESAFERKAPFQSVLEGPLLNSSEIQRVASEDTPSLIPNTTTTYAAIEVPAPAPAVDQDVSTTMNSMILVRLMAVETELATLKDVDAPNQEAINKHCQKAQACGSK